LVDSGQRVFLFLEAIIKVLALDIETSPSICYTWTLFDNRIGIDQIVEPPRMICFSARWLDQDQCMFFSEFHHSRNEMIRKAHELLSECDVLLTFNGKSFDNKHLQREFLLEGLSPPEPYQHIDLYLVARRQFRFISNKLDHIATQLGLEGKVHHSGFDLWKRCLANDPVAWEEMKTYSMRDSDVLIELYNKLIPWITGHPNKALIDGVGLCTRCGSRNTIDRGITHTGQSKFRKFQCLNCGGWLRETRRISGSDLREVT
jgi:DNA polymerase elongation subunit (family B)